MITKNKDGSTRKNGRGEVQAVTLRLDKITWERLDRWCKNRRWPKSRAVERAVRDYLNSKINNEWR
jgi:predicted transcriptional regulator